MLFSSLFFIMVFLPLTLLLYFGLYGRRRAQNLLLVILSLFFYAWGEPTFVLIMLLSIAVNYAAGLLVVRYRGCPTKKLVLLASIAFNIGLLVAFKYLDFFIDSANRLFSVSFPMTGIQLPIGISFFTFQAMSYVLDVNRGHGKAAANPLDVGLYISLFPQLIAGPIVRYETIADQIAHRRETLDDVILGANRFVIGLAKKVLIANNVAVVADHAFSVNGSALSPLLAWVGIIAYTLQIYFDFSGYSDMAIGLGRIFGFHFPENFNYPYFAKSVSDFWRRWHISLSTWFRDYVYIPLGGSRVGRPRLVFNLFVVWSLTGLWHGASLNFILWGLLYFFLLTLEKLFAIPNQKAALFYRIFTLLCVVFGWVLFRSSSLEHAGFYSMCLLGIADNGVSNDSAWFFIQEYGIFLIAGMLFSVPVANWASLPGSRVFRGRAAACVFSLLIFALFFLSVSSLVYGSYNPFIYFNF